MLTLQPVNSSNIAGIAYDRSARRLFVGFIRKGKPGSIDRVYEYTDVPPDVYREFMEAPSKGKYFQGRIKDVFNAHQVESDVTVTTGPIPRKQNDADAAVRLALVGSIYCGSWF